MKIERLASLPAVYALVVKCLPANARAPLAQWIERLASDQKVKGSSPLGGTGFGRREYHAWLRTKGFGFKS